MKRCVACKQTLDESEFYKNRAKADGLTTECKGCAKAKASRYGRSDRGRSMASTEARRATKRRWSRTAVGREKNRRQARKHRATHPEKVAARWALQLAVMSGQVVRQPCEVCGKPRAHGHHEDYSKPLEVRWLCREHHAQVHAAPGAP